MWPKIDYHVLGLTLPEDPDLNKVGGGHMPVHKDSWRYQIVDYYIRKLNIRTKKIHLSSPSPENRRERERETATGLWKGFLHLGGFRFAFFFSSWWCGIRTSFESSDRKLKAWILTKVSDLTHMKLMRILLPFFAILRSYIVYNTIDFRNSLNG